MNELRTKEPFTRISDRLSQAWAFLSGEERTFEYFKCETEPLHYAAFSIFMPVAVPKYARSGGVSVLIQYEDAVRVAVHMFGIASNDVHHADLQDACAEVCNVMCDCIAVQFSGGEEFSMGLPWVANAREFQHIASRSVVKAVYRGSTSTQDLFVVLYDSLSPPQ